MKKSNFDLAATSLAEQLAGKSWRKALPWYQRWAVALLLLILLAGASILVFSLYRPLAVFLPTQVYAARRTASIDYQVLQGSPDQQSETLLGENQVYISSLARAVKATFHYTWQAPSASDLTWSDAVTASLQIREANGEKRVLFEETKPVIPVAVASQSSAGYQLDRQATVEIAPFTEEAKAFADQSKIQIISELVIRHEIKTQANVPGGIVAYVDQPALVIPLTPDTFEVREVIPRLGSVRTWRWLPYAIALLPIPFWAYYALDALLLTLLILWLSLTRTRRPDRFDRQLRRMQRLARGRLMLITDKAWEPEWCVTATDYRTLVKTARRLKHPIFCHVDRTGEQPVAYFYVYYGENNYCLTFRPEGVTATSPALQRPSSSGQLMGDLTAVEPAGEDAFGNEPNPD